MLHFVVVGGPSLDDILLESGRQRRHGASAALAARLADNCWGLTPGFHRLAFESGHLLLTLCIGDAPESLLRAQRLEADAIWLDAADARPYAFPRDAHDVRLLTRCCRRGARLTVPRLSPPLRELLARGGFSFDPATEPSAPEHAPDAGCSARFDPGWTPRTPYPDGDRAAARADSLAHDSTLVIGAGIAGAAVAASLARRGHRVCVLDAANHPASAASGLPAGLFAPHVSADDSALSQIARAGIRQTLQYAHEHLVPRVDWQPCGVLEIRADAARLAASVLGPAPMRDWSDVAGADEKAAAGIAAATGAIWHRRAGWIKPAALVRALLAQERIELRGAAEVARLDDDGSCWRALDRTGAPLAEAARVVIAAGARSAALVPGALPLQPIRGQVSYGARPAADQTASAALPPFAVNGDGSFLPDVLLADDGRCWIAGASFERDSSAVDVRAADHAANLARLRRLLPAAAERLASSFDARAVHGWAGVRCAARDRLPVVGSVRPRLWVSTALGSRGLSFALLCAELLAARMHREPLPLPDRLARLLDVQRLGGGSSSASMKR